MAIQNFMNVFEELSNLGVMDSLLPFLLVFTILFAVLEKTKIIGEGKKQFNVMIALIISLTVVIPHVMNKYPPGQDVVQIINSALPNVSVVIIAIVMLLLLLGVFGIKWTIGGTSVGAIIAIISIIVVVFIFGGAAGWWNRPAPPFNFLNDPDTQALIIIILVFGVILWWITGGEGPGVSKGLKGFLENLGKTLEGSK